MSSFNFGWIAAPREVDRIASSLPEPDFSQIVHLKGSGRGKKAFLWQFLMQACGGRWPLHEQTIGDCVSHGFGTCADVLAATQIYLGGRAEEFKAEAATEVIYAGSRVEIGRGGAGRGDGSIGAWAAKWVKDYGIVPRGKYPAADLSAYSGQRAKSWGMPNAGVPNDLEPLAKERPIQATTLVNSYEDVIDALSNGYTVPPCSNVGFTMNRDKKGYCSPSGRWDHCMAFVGYDDTDPDPWVAIANSWGAYIPGQDYDGLYLPAGIFKCRAETVTRICRQGDTWALSNFKGWPGRQMPDFNVMPDFNIAPTF